MTDLGGFELRAEPGRPNPVHTGRLVRVVLECDCIIKSDDEGAVERLVVGYRLVCPNHRTSLRIKQVLDG